MSYNDLEELTDKRSRNSCAELLIASGRRWSVSISSLTDENHLIPTVTNCRISIKRAAETSW